MGPVKSSCWIVAGLLLLRRPKDTWLSVRRSDHFWAVPHIGVVRRYKDGRIRLLHYRPLSPKTGWRVIFDMFWFRGRIHINRDVPDRRE